MLNIEAFRELCRKAAAERDPAKLERIRNELRFMLRAEGIERNVSKRNPA
jgi:hypothetical protein